MHPFDPPQTTESLAEDILSSLFTAQINDKNRMIRIQDIVRVTGLYKTLAVAVLNRMENALKAEVPMGQAMRDAYERL